MALLGLKGDFDKFKDNHPKFLQFAKAFTRAGIQEGTIMECKVITADGQELQTNIQITADDLELFEKLKNLRQDM
ncbi:MAG: hypothetical protein K1W26_18620 [Acetatifactor sp.]